MRRIFGARAILVFFVALSPLFGTCQRKEEKMIWLQAMGQTSFMKERFSSTLLFQRRIFPDRQDTHQHLYWLSAVYYPDPSLTIGGGFIYLDYFRPVGEHPQSVPEIRPFQSIGYKKTLRKSKISFRLMIEERFLTEIENQELQTTKAFNLRYRGRFRIIFPAFQKLRIELSNELILNGQLLDVSVFGQNRGIARLHYNLDIFKLSAGYLHWLIKTSSGYEYRNTLLLGISRSF